MIRRDCLLFLSSVSFFWLGTPFLAVASSVPSVSQAVSQVAPVDANIFVNLSKKMVPSVVNISTLSTVKSPLIQGSPDDVLRKFFGDLFRQYPRGGPGGGSSEENDSESEPESGDEHSGRQRSPGRPLSRLPRAMSLGTGFIIDASGLILTNNHVVASADEVADEIKISFTESSDEKPSDAVVVGRDPEIDVALIKVKTKREIFPVVLGDSDALDVGEYVMAVGNPYGQGHSVTHGIISAKGRTAPDFPLANYLQTDAPINPGNSGGPLINLKGEVIGINNAIDQRAQGIGFAIPINLVKKVLPQLRSKGSVARGYIGVLVDQLTPAIAKKMGISKTLHGPVVSHVYPGEPADKAGIQPYDVILEFNGKPVQSGNDLIMAVTGVVVGESVPMKIVRSGTEKIVTIRVGQRPSAKQVAQTSEEAPKSSKKLTRIETGMSLEELTPEIARELGIEGNGRGVVVTQIAYGGPADKAGLLRGDVILEVDRKGVKGVEDFFSIVKEKKSYLLRIRRIDPQGREMFSVVVLDLKGEKREER